MEEVAAAFADGLTLGVCAALPEDRPPEPYATCEEARACARGGEVDVDLCLGGLAACWDPSEFLFETSMGGFSEKDAVEKGP